MVIPPASGDKTPPDGNDRHRKGVPPVGGDETFAALARQPPAPPGQRTPTMTPETPPSANNNLRASRCPVRENTLTDAIQPQRVPLSYPRAGTVLHLRHTRLLPISRRDRRAESCREYFGRHAGLERRRNLPPAGHPQQAGKLLPAAGDGATRRAIHPTGHTPEEPTTSEPASRSGIATSHATYRRALSPDECRLAGRIPAGHGVTPGYASVPAGRRYLPDAQPRSHADDKGEEQ